MKTLVAIVLMLSSFTVSRAQLISFNALKNGVIDDTEIRKELILNGFTMVTDNSDSSTDLYAYGYTEEFENAAIWVSITTFGENDINKVFLIGVQTTGHEIHEHLKKEIVNSCKFDRIGDNGALVYKNESSSEFHIFSTDGNNFISVIPSIDSMMPVVEKWMEEQEEKEEQRQEELERLNYMGKDAFGSPDADRYDTPGGLGDGITVGGMGTRKTRSLPKPNLLGCEVTQKIEIIVDIQVDREGKVVNAIIRSATYQDNCIWNTVTKAAKNSRFTSDQGANFRQTGWIKYIIVP